MKNMTFTINKTAAIVATVLSIMFVQELKIR